jgi:hypothetical protein
MKERQTAIAIARDVEAAVGVLGSKSCINFLRLKSADF